MRNRAQIHVLQFTAHGDTTRQTRHMNIAPLHQLRHGMRRRFALRGKARSQNDLLHSTFHDPLQQLWQANVLGTHTIHGRDAPHQHKVVTTVGTRALHRC